jgi:uncharacterized protein with HEPN domain
MWRDAASLYDIVESGRRVLAYCEGLSAEQFARNTLVQDAVIRRLTIMGEAAKRISHEFRTAHSEVPWHEMAGFRDIAVHDYLAIVPSRVWTVVRDDLPGLVSVLDPLIAIAEDDER